MLKLFLKKDYFDKVLKMKERNYKELIKKLKRIH